MTPRVRQRPLEIPTTHITATSRNEIRSFSDASQPAHTSFGNLFEVQQLVARPRQCSVCQRDAGWTRALSEELDLPAHVCWFETVVHELKKTHDFAN